MPDPVLTIEQDRTERLIYLQRLRLYLQAQVALGNMGQGEATRLFTGTAKQVINPKPGINPKGEFAFTIEELFNRGSMPFAEDVAGTEWDFRNTLKKFNEQVRAKQINQINRVASQSDYLGQLGAMLNQKANKGEITQDQANQTLAKEQSDIAEGITPEASPNFNRVQEYFQGIQKQAEAMKPNQREQKLLDAGVSPAEHFRQLGAEQRAMAPSADTLEYQNWQNEQMVKASQWEAERQRQLALAGKGNYGWIQRWQAEHAVNPFVTSRQEQERRDQDFNELARQPLDIQQKILAQNQLQTPDWLAKMTGLTAGQPLERSAVAVPSGQQWSAMLPSQQEKWAGYADWAGAGAEDLLARMEQMRTETPRIAWNWSPARARI